MDRMCLSHGFDCEQAPCHDASRGVGICRSWRNHQGHRKYKDSRGGAENAEFLMKMDEIFIHRFITSHCRDLSKQIVKQDLRMYGLTMDTQKLVKERIWIDPARCGGKPCIRGHRIWVSLILDLLAAGEPISEILQNYPGLVNEDIHACIAYGAAMSRERFVPVELEPAA